MVSVRLIEQNMRKFGSLSAGEFHQALVWGSKPLIVIGDLTDVGTCGADGLFQHAVPNLIQISLGRVQ